MPFIGPPPSIWSVSVSCSALSMLPTMLPAVSILPKATAAPAAQPCIFTALFTRSVVCAAIILTSPFSAVALINLSILIFSLSFQYIYYSFRFLVRLLRHIAVVFSYDPKSSPGQHVLYLLFGIGSLPVLLVEPPVQLS